MCFFGIKLDGAWFCEAVWEDGWILQLCPVMEHISTLGVFQKVVSFALKRPLTVVIFDFLYFGQIFPDSGAVIRQTPDGEWKFT